MDSVDYAVGFIVLEDLVGVELDRSRLWILMRRRLVEDPGCLPTER